METAENTEEIMKTSYPQGKKIFSNIGISYVILIIATFVAQLIVMLLIMPWAKAHSEWYQKYMVLINVLPMYLFGVPLCVLWMRRIPVTIKVPDRPWKPGKLLIVLVIAEGLLYGGNLVSALLMGLTGILRGRPVTNDLLGVLQNADMLAVFVAVVILAPIIEEFLFRKLLIDRIYPYGEKVCVLISGLLFGLMHGNFYQFLYAFLLGAVFAYIYVKTGRMRYGVIFHMIVNFMGSVVGLWVIKIMERVGVTGNPAALFHHFWLVILLFTYVGVLMMLFVGGITLLICLRKYITFERGAQPLEKGRAVQTIFLNIGIILFLLMCIVQFAMSLL